MTPFVDSAFWKGRRVFLTGHTGFKGAWLSLWLAELGAEVTGYSLAPPSEPNLFTLAKVGEGLADIRGDIRDLDSMSAAMKKADPEIVIHMAAQALVRPSYADPVGTYATNVMGTVNLLEACRSLNNLRAALIITSDKSYENREWHCGYRESDPMGGHDPYSSSKGAAEIVTSAMRRSFFADGPSVASARAGNVIGGGDWGTDRLLPDMMRAFAEGETVIIRHPDAIRPWQHVLDPLAGYMMLIEKMFSPGQSFAEGWNFGPLEDNAQPVGHLVERAAALWGESAGWKLDPAPKLHEATFLKLDISMARARLGWRPRLDLETALALTVNWYRAHQKGEDMPGFTRQQIKNYAAGAKA